MTQCTAVKDDKVGVNVLKAEVCLSGLHFPLNSTEGGLVIGNGKFRVELVALFSRVGCVWILSSIFAERFSFLSFIFEGV